MLRSHASLFPKIFNTMISKHERNEMTIFKVPLVEKLGMAKSIKLLQCDISQFDTREMYEYFGNEDYQELPQHLMVPSKMQTKLLFFLSDIVNELVRAEGGEKYPDLTKFIKAELVVYLA